MATLNSSGSDILEPIAHDEVKDHARLDEAVMMSNEIVIPLKFSYISEERSLVGPPDYRPVLLSAICETSPGLKNLKLKEAKDLIKLNPNLGEMVDNVWRERKGFRKIRCLSEYSDPKNRRIALLSYKGAEILQKIYDGQAQGQPGEPLYEASIEGQ